MERFKMIAFIAAIVILSSPSSAEDDLTNEDCLVCHSDEELTKEGIHGEAISLFIDGALFEETIHGDFSCGDCHTGISELPHDDDLPEVDCAECHPDVVEEYNASSHGLSRSKGNGDAPTCLKCHGDIHVLVPLDDPGSPVHPARLPETCGYCHANPELVAKFGIHVARPIEAYRDSAHARAVANGENGASCNDCHSSHSQFPGSDPASTVYRPRVPDTCGTCHEEITAAYRQSIHGTAMSRGILEAPVCTDCHGEHFILSPREAGSPVSPSNQAVLTCGRCHGDLRLSEKYDLPADKVPTYQNSYHGLAARAGSQMVAGCASCHGVHDILPSTDPASHVHKDNLAETCGRCHPGAGKRFAIGEVHVVDTDARFPVVHFIRLVYIPLIVFTIGGMLLHVALDFRKKWDQSELRVLSISGSSGEERMMRGFRVAHGLVMASFPVLVYTGFALKYPDAWWARPIVALGSDARGWLHRAAGVVLIGSLAYHVVHLIRNRRARACIANMRPCIGDWRELKDRFKYYIGMRNEPVHSPTVGYIEKAEYLAFWWGMMVMAVTGFLLWFENFTLSWLPSWVPGAATAVHWYEAILATLAILIWHFYWTVFDPAVYPMDMSWWTGKAPASRELERRPHRSMPSEASTTED